jgi:outer membrane receptor protein involved in Fe transport
MVRAWLLLLACGPALVSASEALEEVVVLGERTPRVLQQTASSVVVVSADDLEAHQALASVDDVLADLPNLQVGSGGEGVAIRGQDSTGALRDLSASLGGTRPRVTMQVDGRPLSYFEYVFGTTSVWDLSQIEVFRSPQTTTQGRNSIAGAIFVETQSPQYDWQARARVQGGNWGARRASLAVTGPLLDGQLAFRASADYQRKRSSSDMLDGVVDADLDQEEASVARLKLLAEPAALPGLRLEGIYVHGRSEAPQFEAIQAPFTTRVFSRLDRTNGVYRIDTDSLTLRSQWSFSPQLDWRTTISGGEVFSRRFGLPGLGLLRLRAHDLSLDSTLVWQGPGALSVTGGVYALQSRQRQSLDITGLTLGIGEFRDRQYSVGVFGEARWRPAEDWTMTLGLRYQRDRQDRSGQLARPAGPIPLEFDRTFDAWLPKLTISHDLAPGVTAGLLVQRAFNPGGTTFSLVTCLPDDFDEESLWNYEAFWRAELGEGRARLSLNVFQSRIRDAQRGQLATVVPCGLSPSRTLIGNAPSARTKGAELQLDWRATTRLDLGLGLGMLGTRVLRTELPTDPTLNREFQRSPAFTGSARLVYRPTAMWRLSANVRTNSEYFSDDANTAALRIPGATFVDADVSRIFGPVTVSAYARNLLDRYALTYLFSSTAGTARDPREYGLSVEVRLGER